MTPDRLDALRADLRAFVKERDWDQFHAPKDLALSLAIEAGELLEVFQWRRADEPLPPDVKQRVRDEVADVVMYALLLADREGFDVIDAAREKLAQNRAKYPVEKARGKSDKYDKL